MSGQTPFDDLSFRRKEDALDYPNALEFGVGKGLQFREGFNSGEQVSLILDQIAFPYSEIKDFNDLPIPFACVATDLVSGKAKVFHDGSLALALRSTMSLPGIFSPVRQKSSVYADGGLLDNLPVEVAKAMGADLILAIHLEESSLSPDARLSSLGVLSRSISVMISANELQSMEQADIVVSVPLQKYEALSFDHADEIIQIGYAAAAAKSKVLMTLSVDDQAWNDYLAERKARRRIPPTPTFVAVEGAKGNLSRRVEEQVADVVGKPVDYVSLDSDLLRLMGSGRFSNLTYQLVERDGRQGLAVKTEEKVMGR
jgi:NTE family protein